MVTNGDLEGHLFLSHPHRNDGSIFLPTTNSLFCIVKKTFKRLPENPEYAEM